MSKSERQPFIEQADRIRQLHQDKLAQFVRGGQKSSRVC